MPRIPTVFEARDRINEDIATPLDQFIFDHEPMRIDRGEQFRKDLAKLLSSELAQMADHLIEVRTEMQKRIDTSDRFGLLCAVVAFVLFVAVVLTVDLMLHT